MNGDVMLLLVRMLFLQGRILPRNRFFVGTLKTSNQCLTSLLLAKKMLDQLRSRGRELTTFMELLLLVLLGMIM